MSAKEFTYLAHAMEDAEQTIYKSDAVLHNHCYPKTPSTFAVDMEYADDITSMSADPNKIQFKKKV